MALGTVQGHSNLRNFVVYLIVQGEEERGQISPVNNARTAEVSFDASSVRCLWIFAGMQQKSHAD